MLTLLSVVSRYWWVLVLRGVAGVLFGLGAFLWPSLTLAALVLLFGAFALVDGVFGVIAGIASYGGRQRWWATLLSGLLSLAAGLITLAAPGLTAVALLYIIALWAIVRGALEIAAAIRLRKVIDNEWMLGAAGALSVAFGLLILMRPAAGALAVIWWIGAFALVSGVLLIVLGLRVKTLGATLVRA